MTALAAERFRRSAGEGGRRLRAHPFALAGLVIVLGFALTAIAAPILPLPDPDAAFPANRLAPPFSEGHPLGTDQLGRDVLSRVVWGLRVSLAVGAGATLAACVAGTLIGLFAAFYGRAVDGVLMRLVDVLMAFPYLLLALAIVAALGPGLANAALAIAIVNVPFFARAVRGAALGVVGRDYVAAARLAGLSDLRILATEVFPNVAPLVIVTAATTIGWMILETAGLSFLGLGAQPPQADLGSMLGDGRKVAATAPHLAAVPGLVAFVLVVGLNLLGDGLRDILDPRMRGGRGGAPAPATALDRASAEPAQNGGALLEVCGLTTAFDGAGGRHAAVRDVSFQLQKGEAVGVVGESGSGKSVTALSLSRLAASPPGAITAGRVLLDGADVLDAPFPALQGIRGGRIAYVFQDPLTTLNPMMRIGDQIVEAVRDGEPRGRAIALLEQVGLPDPQNTARRYPHQLSGGQRQRVGVAIAFAGEPDVLIADEPTTALDASTQARVLELFRATRKESGAALLFVSHDLGVVAGLCDRILVMYAGEIVEAGPTAEVLARPRHPYTARLIACAPRLGEPDRVLEPIEGGPPAIDDPRQGCAFAPRCDLAIDACRRAPIPLDDLGHGRAARCIRSGEVSA